jgi:hypothetical protein
VLISLSSDPPESQILSKNLLQNDDDIFMNDVVFFNTYHFESNFRWVLIRHQVALENVWWKMSSARLDRDQWFNAVIDSLWVTRFTHTRRRPCNLMEIQQTCHLKQKKRRKEVPLEMGKFGKPFLFPVCLFPRVCRLTKKAAGRELFRSFFYCPTFYFIIVLFFSPFGLVSMYCCNPVSNHFRPLSFLFETYSLNDLLLRDSSQWSSIGGI